MTDWLSVIRGDLERALVEMSADQLEALAGLLVTYQLRAERQLRTAAASPAPDVAAPVSADEIGAVLGVPGGAVREWGRSGRVPCERYGRFVRFRLGAVKAALAANSKTTELVTSRRSLNGKGSKSSPTGHLPREGAGNATSNYPRGAA